MAYTPGSFSKNFAWHGTGLRKLHNAIRDGFNDTLAAIERQQFRSASGLDASLSLIPINFFLHNQAGRMSVDELVYQAVENPHSIRFDRLGMFALHLNRAGNGGEIVSRPAMWANEFVRERLWSEGVWQAAALSEASLDEFFEDRIEAEDGVRVKCRTNYRHLFVLCEYLPTSLPIINSGVEDWLASALFLAWDRHTLDGGASDEDTLVGLIEDDELYKLLGVSQGYALEHGRELAALYVSLGGLERFQAGVKAPTPYVPAPDTPATELSEEEGIGWLDQEESDESVERQVVTRLAQDRDRRKAAALKQHYDNTCIFCEAQLQIAEDRFYSEAAHIKAVGQPHNGPDKTGNMLVLCPNHHIQFDRGVLRLRKVDGTYRIESKAEDDPLHDKAITLRHELDEDCVKYHHDWFGSERT